MAVGGGVNAVNVIVTNGGKTLVEHIAEASFFPARLSAGTALV